MNQINTNNFDFLRVIFALTVAISHFIELSGVKTIQHLSPLFSTRLAIDGFFIISGFLIAKSYNKSSSIKDYIIRRIKRIVPAYTILIICCAIFLYFISSKDFQSYFINKQFWKYLIANLSFQNYIEPCLPGVFEKNNINAVNGALWTIKIEEAFYLILPVFYWLVNKKKWNIYFLTFIIYLSSIIFFNYFVHVDKYRIAKQLPGAMSFFVTGILLYNNFSIFIKLKHYLIVPCLIIFILEHFILNTQVLKPFSYGFMVFYLAYGFEFLNNFGKYGDFTYGIYIYHFPVIQTFVHFELYTKYNPLIIGILTFFVIILLSILSWKHIELPNLPESRRKRHENLLGKI
ncbi:acyltransferase family protein [Seonamhaeicola marinus]|uniref:acyltransferase family protein n=1 Tax=Seonamhaeicola marinus TaxID=1912246 RepID=UPI001652B5D3|nr:acyltransferase [Seonamhaeicola marinus]